MAEVLTREASANQVAFRQVMLPDGPDVVELDGVREPRLEEFKAVLVSLDDGDGPHPGFSKPGVEPAYPGEQGNDPHWNPRHCTDLCTASCNSSLVGRRSSSSDVKLTGFRNGPFMKVMP